MLPLVEELHPVPDVFEALRAFAAWPDVILFESVLKRPGLGRYSFLSADPVATFELQEAVFGHDPFEIPRQWAQRFRAERIPDLPPFQGGVAGHLSYELGGCFERLPRATCDEFKLPVSFFGHYDWVLCWDHQLGRAWLISQGFPEIEAASREQRAALRLHQVREQLSSGSNSVTDGSRDKQQSAPCSTSTPQFELAGHPGITSNFSREQYLAAVERVIEYIRAGDIFQANLSQRLLIPWRRSHLDLYGRLRQCNPAPFAGYLAHDDWAIVSSSPERFLRVRDGEVETRPIKGTRQRRAAPEADLFTKDELRESEKDTAENVMIVDLLRNDLSRVCEPGSISVPQLCTVETYETVQHLVSEVRGRLSKTEQSDVWSLLAATFPGGSITGAPKVRAMQIIAELEPTVRGPYCGSLFYVSADGTMDSNILIRTFVSRHEQLQCCVGGGVVAQSHPVAEYEETLHKAAGLLRVFK